MNDVTRSKASHVLNLMGERIRMECPLRRAYIHDTAHNVWRRSASARPFEYNDGDEIEERIARIITSASDLSSLSPELAGQTTDWASIYHLSPSRSNLLRPLAGLFRGLTLDVGAGCGAITRFLGEQGRVVALEGSRRRAEIAASRCRDLSSVTVVCDNIEDFETDVRFDAITAIGVLEYARSYLRSPDPARALLKQLRSLLTDDGSLVLAIENQLGLKYFNGALEDHLQAPMSGINDSYAHTPVSTYGRGELERMLIDSGFEQVVTLLPLPDYKLTSTVVLPEGYRRDPNAFDLGTFLSGSAFADAQQAPAPLFSLEKAWRVVARNGLAPELANSFLIVARLHRIDQPLGEQNQGVLVRHYGPPRHPRFARAVVIAEHDGSLEVRREPLGNSNDTHPGLRIDYRPEPYVHGSVWTDRLADLLNEPGWTLDAVAEWARPWERLLVAAMAPQMEPSLDSVLPPNYIDATPFNVLLERGGSYRFFDLEWIASEPVGFGHVLFRGLLWALAKVTSVAAPAPGVPLGVLELTTRVAARLGWRFDDAEVERSLASENEFRSRVTGVRSEMSVAHVTRMQLRVRHSFADYEASREHIKAQDNRITELIQAESLREARSKDALARVCSDRERLTADLARARTRIVDLLPLEAEVAALRADLQLLKDAAVQRNGAIQRALAAEQKAAESDSRIRALEADRASESARAGALAHENALLRASAESAAARAQHLEGVATLAGIQQQEAARRLREVLGSKSWQWTAPVRALQSGFKRVLAEAVYLPLMLLRRVAGLATAAKVVAQVRWLDPTFLLRGVVDLHEFSLVFDPQFYSSTYPDVAAGRFHPLAHYLAYGAGELRHPNPLFDPRYYCLANPAARSNPLIAYLAAGGKHGPDPHPLFDTKYFLERNPGAAATQLSPLAFFLSLKGEIEIPAHPLFDSAFYLSQGPIEPGMSALVHYVVRGGRERRNPHPLFDTTHYLEQVRERDGIAVPLAHYVVEGAARGLRPHTLFDPVHFSTHYPHVPAAKALAHYVMHGAAQCLSPNPLFDGGWYVDRYPEVGINPLQHYVVAGAASGRDPHPLFDTSFYVEKYADAAASGINPLAHYLFFGVARHLQPHPLFDADFYLASNPDVREAGVAPLFHFLAAGGTDGRDPHPLFDTSFYVDKYPDVAASGLNPLVHYIAAGIPACRDPHPLFNASFYNHLYQAGSARCGGALIHYILEGGAAGCHPSMLFDAPYYIRTYFGGDAAGVNPLVHYVTEGAARRWRPNPLFDSVYYLRRYPDVANSGMLPLVHFTLRGDKEGRRPNPLFNTSFYNDRNPDVPAAELTALGHYLWAGAREGRDPHLLFDTSFYLESNPDVADSGMNPLEHFLLSGGAEGRDPSVLFDSQQYLRDHPEVAAARMNPLVHYLENGSTAGVATEASLLPPRIPGLEDAEELRVEIGRTPLISVLLPVYNTPPEYLRAALDSVLHQRYPHWELCVCDDGSTRAETKAVLEQYAAVDARIRLHWSPANGGISRATNSALDAARGEFVAMLDHDDLLEPDALLEIARALNEDPDIDVLYTDQDYIEPDGKLSRRFHKPAWSLEMFRGVMYVGHLLVVRRTVALAAGAFDPAFDNVQDFEFMLRVAERTDRIRHVPLTLYHWRMIPGSVAASGDAKPNIERLQAAAVTAHLRRMGVQAEAVPHPHLAHRAMIQPLRRAALPSVSVITYPNAGAAPAAGEFIVFMHASVQPQSRDWIEQLLFYAEREGVGAVAPIVLDGSGRVKSAGLVLGRGGPVPAMAGQHPNADGYAGSLSCSREVSAVPGDCLMIRKRVLEEIGGWNDLWRTPLYAGADLSIRARRAGLQNICQARVAVTSGASSSDEHLDRLLFLDIYGEDLAAGDPFHNPNFAAAFVEASA